MTRHPSAPISQRLSLPLIVAVAAIAATGAAQADIQITEFMYNGNGPSGEYVEITNLGPAPVDFTGWSFDDDSRAAGTVSLSAFGTVAPGQSVMLTEASATVFASAWNLASDVRIIGGNSTNLGRADEINIFDAGGNLVDRLTYGDNVIAGTVRPQNFSANPLTLAALQPFAITNAWVLAAAGDGFGSYASTLGDIGSPGSFALPVPEPASVALLVAGLGLVTAAARRRA